MYLGRTSLDPADIISENFASPSDAGTFTWVNQGTSTISEVPGNHLMLVPAGGGVNNLRMRSVLTPLSSPFTITMAFQPIMASDTFQTFGIILRDSTGRAYLWGLNYNTGWQWVRHYWNSPTSFNASLVINAHFLNSKPTSTIWIRIVNDGSLLRLQISLDNGNTFVELQTEGQFAFLSDFDEYGYGGSASSAADFYCNVISYGAA